MRIETAKSAGFCGGVQRAVDMTVEQAKKRDNVVVYGELVHNPTVVQQMEELGVRTIDKLEDMTKDDFVVIRAHGVPKWVYEYFDDNGIEYIDTTCPLVKKVHKIAEEIPEDAIVFMTGDPTHPEVVGIAGHCKAPINYIQSSYQTENYIKVFGNIVENDIILLSQTTYNIVEWNKCEKKLKKVYTNIKIFDTICRATMIRQQEAMELSSKVDSVIVIGGRNSSNTHKLFDICKANCHTVMVETAAELENYHELLKEQQLIGITAGASTPDCIIKEVQQQMNKLENISNDMSFEEMLEQSFKSTYNGEKVTAIVTGVKPNEISVDIGTKHAGYVPLNELTDDPTLKSSDIVKVGDELELLVVRVNDVEGTTMLSKKRLDAAAGFEKIMTAGETGELLTGRVTEVIKGGLLVQSNGVKIFVPASQSGVPRDGDLNQLLRQEVTFKILETNRQRRRALGSISVVAREQRKVLADKFWESVEVNKEYTGVVKSITNFGVFVDLGGVDGRISLTDLTWLRVKHPSEIVSIGDNITVTIKDINTEEKKISLVYKKTEDNPWEVIKTQYQVGDVVSVTVMSVTAFGAFAQIIPGIDGLIHISQIANERVEKVSDKLAVGDVVEAKITELDFERRRASLSIKALLPEPEVSEEADEVVAVAEPVTPAE